jgi:hypothetical protein
MAEIRNVAVRKLEGKRLQGWSVHRWEDDIKMDLKYVSWVHLAQDRV